MKHSENKMAFQSNANRPIANSLGYTVNKSEDVWMWHVARGGGGPQLKMFQHVWRGDHHITITHNAIGQ